MYNGIGILSVRGSGTSGYVQGNKFNLRGGRPVQSRFPDTAADKGPTQRQPDESILQHNQKRQIELKLLAEEEKLADQGLTEAEIDEKVAALRLQLEKADEVTPESEQRVADETHAIAKRKLAQMAKLRDVFGFTIEQDSKEGESFDRELQEQRKRDRLMEKELREKTKVKEARARAKEIRHKQREEKRAIKKAEKDRQKEEKARFKAQELRHQQREEERAKAIKQAKQAEARAKAIRDAPPPERYVPRGPSPVREAYSSESEDERLPLPPPTRGRLASQIVSRPHQPAAVSDRRSKSLSPDPVKTAVTHAEPPRHTKVASPPRRPRPDRSSSPPPTRRHIDHDEARPSSRHTADALDRDRAADRASGYGDKHGSSRDRTDGRHDNRREAEDLPYGDRSRRSDTDRAAYGDRLHRTENDRAPYGDRPYGDRQLQRTHYEDSRYRESDRSSRDRLAQQRAAQHGGSRDRESRHRRDSRSPLPPRRPADGRDSKRKRSPSSSSSSGTSGSSSSGTSGSGSSTSGSSGSSYTSSSGPSRS